MHRVYICSFLLLLQLKRNRWKGLDFSQKKGWGEEEGDKNNISGENLGSWSEWPFFFFLHVVLFLLTWWNNGSFILGDEASYCALLLASQPLADEFISNSDAMKHSLAEKPIRQYRIRLMRNRTDYRAFYLFPTPVQVSYNVHPFFSFSFWSRVAFKFVHSRKIVPSSFFFFFFPLVIFSFLGLFYFFYVIVVNK